MTTATAAPSPTEIDARVHLRRLHPSQRRVCESRAKRKMVRAGRRWGKTTLWGRVAVDQFLAGRRVLYASPTARQVRRFWFEVKRALREPIEAGAFVKNETNKTITLPDSEQEISALTAWNADTLRGDWCDLLILDEYQLMDEEVWERVGQPMLVDTNGDAIFSYTPPSLRSRSVSKARDKRHAAKLWKRHAGDSTGRWECFTFTSQENPHLSSEAIAQMAEDMTALAYRQEILAEDLDEVPGALWKRGEIDEHRLSPTPRGPGLDVFEYGGDGKIRMTPQGAPVRRSFRSIVIGVDPAVEAGPSSDETGIMVVAQDSQRPGHYYVLEDATLREATPEMWAQHVVNLWDKWEANHVIAEVNNGGDMVRATLHTKRSNLNIVKVRASVGKRTRAEPVSAVYEQGRAHHVGHFPDLEDQMCEWMPTDTYSPDRMDALVWAVTFLDRGGEGPAMSQHPLVGHGIY